MRALPACLLLTAALAACNTLNRDAVPPVVDVSAAACAKEPSLQAAAGFPPPSKENVFSTTVNVVEGGPCLIDATGKAVLYQVFAIPQATMPLMITVVSVPRGETLLSPKLEIRGENGALLRDVPRSAFLFSGNTLQVQLRHHEGEKYLVVMSDSATVGQKFSQIAGQTTASGVMTGGVYVPIYTGAENATNLTYSHNGKIAVIVGPIPDADKK
jgi:hypothetical protein